MRAKMADSYCIDGTNVVRGCYGYGGDAFRRQEDADTERLIKAFALLCETLDGRIEVVVFFDGAFRPLPSPASNLRVSFTHELPDDDIILDRVRSRRYSGAGRVTVVTGDGELGRKAGEEGARWLRVGPGTRLEDLLRSIERRFH